MKLLHLEDSASDADLIRRRLATAFAELELSLATSLEDAYGLLKNNPTPFDVALIDLHMPDGNGLELVQYIRRRRLPTTVIVMSVANDQQSVINALKSGADDYLSKDSGDERLVEAITSALDTFGERRSLQQQSLEVLYAEHNPVDVDLTRHHLESHAPHIHLTVVASAEDALDRLPQTSDDPCAYDLLLLDYRLPLLDALDVTKDIRRRRRLDLPIVLVSGQHTTDLAVRAQSLGISAYLPKHDNYLLELPATIEKAHYEQCFRRQHEQLRRVSENLTNMVEASPAVLYTLDYRHEDFLISDVSDNIQSVLGYSPQQAKAGSWWADHLYPDDRQRVLTERARLHQSGQLMQDYRFFTASGKVEWLHDELRLRNGSGNSAISALGNLQIVTSQKLLDQSQQARIDIFDQLNRGCPLANILTTIASRLEYLRPMTRVSISLVDAHKNCLDIAASPSLPDQYLAAIERIPIAQGNGSCATAAATGEIVFIEDMATDPLSDKYREVALDADLRACWSAPCKDNLGDVLGVLTMYFGRRHRADVDERNLIDEFSRLCTLVIQRHHEMERLRQSAAVFENALEGMMITNLDGILLEINPAFCTMTGFSAAELVGTNAGIIKSGKHPKSFYQALFSQLKGKGYWQGEVWNRRKNGEIYPVFLAVNTVFTPENEPHRYVGVMKDISQVKASEEHLHHLAHFDALTDLPNRLMMMSDLNRSLSHSSRNNTRVATLFVDLDRFKDINDHLGHSSGDELLVALAGRLKQRLREGDTLYRMGGDEFLLVIDDLKDPQNAAEVAQTILDLLTKPFLLSSDREVFIGASIGISLFPEDGNDVEKLVKHADVAMYQAKELGRNRYQFYTAAMAAKVGKRLDMELALRRGLGNNEFILDYQPQVNCRTGLIVGCEALLRWQPPGQKIIAPDEFIPLAEETGLILPIGEWVLDTACRQARIWLDEGIDVGTIAVNLSASQLNQDGFATSVANALRASELPAERLTLELTESMLMDRGPLMQEVLRSLKDIGVTLSLDDFGTGYSSLAYLHSFPLDQLKIDRSFVQTIPDDQNSCSITTTIITMAKNIQLKVLAEGVETQSQLDFLREQGCSYYQGFLFSRAVDATAFANQMRKSLALGLTKASKD